MRGSGTAVGSPVVHQAGAEQDAGLTDEEWLHTESGIASPCPGPGEG